MTEKKQSEDDLFAKLVMGQDWDWESYEIYKILREHLEKAFGRTNKDGKETNKG